MNSFYFDKGLDRRSVEPKPMLTAADLEGMLRVSRRTISRWVAAGKFPEPIVLGRCVRWRFCDVAVYVGNDY